MSLEYKGYARRAIDWTTAGCLGRWPGCAT